MALSIEQRVTSLEQRVGLLVTENTAIKARLDALEAAGPSDIANQLERIADYQRAQANHYLSLKSEALLP